MKIGIKVLARKTGASAYVKRVIVDYLPSTNMVSFGDNEYSEAVYYFDVNDWDIKEIK